MGEGETDVEIVISPLSLESMNFHLYLFHLLSRSGSGGAVGWLPLHLPKFEPHSQTIGRAQTVASVADEKNNFPDEQ